MNSIEENNKRHYEALALAEKNKDKVSFHEVTVSKDFVFAQRPKRFVKINNQPRDLK